MTNYLVSARIKDDATYDARYAAFVEALKEAKTQGYWAEMTSLWFIQSSLDIDKFGATIAAPLVASKDKLLVREIGSKSTRYFGAVEHAEVLQSFMPEAKKLP